MFIFAPHLIFKRRMSSGHSVFIYQKFDFEKHNNIINTGNEIQKDPSKTEW